VKFLEGLGTVVRTLRNERGLTIKALAKHAGVSERFMAQLEAGDGNISVARLEDVAEALGTTGGDLLTKTTKATQQENQQRAAIAFVGLRGAGKSSIGKSVATKLGIPFVELDEEIVREAQMTLSTIFEIHGEAYYRSMERDVLKRFLDTTKPVVIATGGSLVTDPETWSLLKRKAKTIWLKATPREHWDRVVSQGDVRPMRGRPKAMNELKDLLTARTPLYEEATTTIETSGRTPKEITDEIVRSTRKP
jgi:XRE family transcriptional regulator, aerobic/anaerobic benzoate catabolism transcriptional regulator